MTSTPTPSKRADARRNIEAILDAATTCLARDPETSINDIARAAGVGRVTLYGHFDSRASLVEQVVERAIADTERSLEGVDLTGGAVAAMGRLLDTSWRLTHRYGALVVAAESTLTPARLRQLHEVPARRVERVLRRGRREGVFRQDMPLAWQVTTIQGLLHAAVQSVHQGELGDEQARELVRETVLSALAPRPVPRAGTPPA